jgi:nucleoside-diphosphate-sugar epimerase
VGGTASVAPLRLSAQNLVLPPLRPPEVLVLGGSGFIGQHLIKRLLERGLGVRVSSRNAVAAAVNLRGMAVDIVQGNNSDPAFLRKALQGVHTVYHLAKTDGKNWAHYQNEEVEATRSIADVCAAHGLRRFIYTGTIDSYDAARGSTRIGNETPLDPRIARRNHYARSKAMSENILLGMHRDSKFPVVILRPGVVIGKGAPPAHWGVGKFVSESKVTYWGDGHNMIPLVLVEDVADALDKAFDVPDIEGRTLLVTDKPLMSARDYVAEVSRLSGMKIRAKKRSIVSYFAEDVLKEALKHLSKHPNRRPPSRHDWACRALESQFDSSETEQLLGWTPHGTREALVEQGIKPSIKDAFR